METTSRFIDVNGVTLHVVEAGPADGPLVVLLHGFPDCWWGWRRQIDWLARRGYHVLAPDQRGYNRSGKPRGVAAYDLDVLAADVIGLLDACHCPEAYLVGHDWGGVVAWWAAAHYPDRVARLVVLNAPHPDAWRRTARQRLRQALRSYYVAFFQLPWLPETVLRFADFALLRQALTATSRPGTFTSTDLLRYDAAWRQPGALTAMLNYYRALRRRPVGEPALVRVPTLLLWGTHDAFLIEETAVASLTLCDRAELIFYDTATHWVQLEEAERVNRALERFFRPVVVAE